MSSQVKGNNPYTNSLPPQKLSIARKGKKWREASVDAIINLSSQTLSDNRSSKYTKQVNYNLYNSIFETKDFDHVLNPFGLKGNYSSVATKMKNYNIIRPKIELLKGEEMKRPFSFKVRATNGQVVSERQDEKRKAILQHLQEGLNPTEEGQQPLDSIEKYFKTGYIHPREVTANQILEYGIQAEELQRKFNSGWEHALISSEEVYYVGTHNNEPKVRVVNPLNFDYDKTVELSSIEEAQWAKEERWLAIGEVIDMYGEYLTPEEVDRLDKGEVGYPMNKMNYYPGFAYDMNELEGNQVKTSDAGHASYGGTRTGSHVYVANLVWKSLRKIGFLKYTDPRTGEQEETIVSEDFVLDDDMKALGASLKWQWINEVWEGTRIGQDMYVNIRPLSNQFRDLNNPSECKLPYIGYVYNATNSMSTSMVDLVKPHQYTYMVIWWRLEQELAKAKGKKFVMDFAKLPKSMGFSMDEWMYHFDNTGIIWMNSMEEGRKGDPNSISQFNQMTGVDMSLSQIVGQYLEVLREIESQVDRITGVSRQREANISSSETVGGVERAIQQSNHITEPWFYYHNTVKQKVLNAYIYNFRQTSNGNKKLHYIVNDIESSIITIDGTEFDDSNYNVFVSDSIKDHVIKQKLEALTQIALQQEKVNLSDIIRIYKTESISEIEARIVNSEEAFFKQQADTAKAQQEADQANQEAALKANKEIRDEENIQKQLDRENKIELAIISALGFSEDKDINTNGIPDVIEQGKLALDMGRDAFSQFVEENKLSSEIKKTDADIRQKDKELQLKNKEIDNKEKQNIRDNKTKLKNPTSGEKSKSKK
jgi:hypothetical protein